MKKWKLIGFSVFLSSCSVYDRVPIGSSGSDKLFQDTPNVAASLGGAAEIAMWFVGAWIVFEVLRLGFRGFGIGNGASGILGGLNNFFNRAPGSGGGGHPTDLAPVVKEIQWALKNTDLVCSVSNYTRDITLKYCDVKSAVVRPFISFRECKTNKKGDFILYINPDKHKGLDIFEKIAERLPEKKFLVIGKEDYKPRTDNITVKGYVSDRKEIFDSARLLLVPSVFPDPHPRVAIEAMVNGIPCIASMRGGLPEELADAGILIKNIFNVDEWVEAIKQFDDMAFYNKMSKLSETRVADFEDITQFAKFDLLLDKLSLNHH